MSKSAIGLFALLAGAPFASAEPRVAELLARPALGSADPGVAKAAYAKFVAACSTRSASDLWALFSNRMRGQWDEKAKGLHRTKRPAELRERFGYSGAPDGFSGRALLTALLGNKTSDALLADPCDGVAAWKLVKKRLVTDGVVFIVQRADDEVQTLTFTTIARKGRIDEVGRPRRAEAEDLFMTVDDVGSGGIRY